jgi:hypothetical protein
MNVSEQGEELLDVRARKHRFPRRLKIIQDQKCWQWGLRQVAYELPRKIGALSYADMRRNAGNKIVTCCSRVAGDEESVGKFGLDIPVVKYGHGQTSFTHSAGAKNSDASRVML